MGRKGEERGRETMKYGRVRDDENMREEERGRELEKRKRVGKRGRELQIMEERGKEKK